MHGETGHRLAVAAESHLHQGIRDISNMDKHLLKEIERFFIAYNDTFGKVFKPLGRYGADRAYALVRKATGTGQGGSSTRRAGGTKKTA